MMTNTAAADLGAVLAQHPMGWWVAGMGAFALMGMVALAGLRALRRASPPLDRLLPGLEARGLMLAAMGASACTLVLAGATMAALAESGRSQGPWGALDDAVTMALRDQADTAVLQGFAVLTHLGDTWVLTALTLAVAVALWRQQRRMLATGWLVAMAGNGALTKILKNVFERVRPEHLHGIAQQRRASCCGTRKIQMGPHQNFVITHARGMGATQGHGSSEAEQVATTDA